MLELGRNKDVTFLLVEDDDVDVIAMRRTFSRLKIANDLVVTRNGLEALNALRGENGFAKIKRPFIILLDLNMPKMNGFEFIDAIREDADLRTAVIFVLTTSSDDRDRVAAYERHVAGYVVKARPDDSLPEAISMINNYWRVVELP